MCLWPSMIPKAVTFGVRPEDIHDPGFSPPGIVPARASAKVGVTELMGNEIFAYLDNGPHSFVARLDPRSSFRFGDDAEVVFNMGNFHIFDNETEQAIR